MRILVVEDEKDLNRIIAKTLTAEGMSVDSCFDGEEAMEFIRGAEYDAAVMDISMPKKDGLSVVREMREAGNATPVLFLSARDSIGDRVAGLDSGADDYLVKPFSYDELLARVRVLTRKYTGNKTNVYTLADLTVNTEARSAARGGKDLGLSAKEYALLEYLIRNKGVVLSRENIENNIWNYDYAGGTNVVDVYMSYLRKKVDNGFDRKLIHTVWGAGWVLREESA
ncbi:MAG TPA: response regulator transcription factor [Oscillospiraceae bacterium]|nr:response regulator transcription factor [Oscillospiraceae bacterium]